jgi:hypothetical protein
LKSARRSKDNRATKIGIRAEEREKRIQLQKLVESTERATSAEKDILKRPFIVFIFPLCGHYAQ